MKATGIVRRIDELGRIVVPKEIRRTLRIRENDPLEIFTSGDGEIILKKYSPIAELSAFAMEYVGALNGTFGHSAAICDMEHVIAAAGQAKKAMQDKKLSQPFDEWLLTKQALDSADGSLIPVVQGQETSFAQQMAVPILLNGDVAGAVFMAAAEEAPQMGEAELLALKTAALYLARQLDT